MPHFLLEAPVGYFLFDVVEAESIARKLAEAQGSMEDLKGFSKAVKLHAFQAFETLDEALNNVLKISEGEMSEELKNFLRINLKLSSSSSSKQKNDYLGVADPKLASAIQEELDFPCQTTDLMLELMRGARTHLHHFLPSSQEENEEGGGERASGEAKRLLEQARPGLGHAYSRSKIKFNVNRQDNMIIQAIQLLDQMDKDNNTAAMRIREWYGWHFPELAKIVSDPYLYARLVNVIGDRETLLAVERKNDDDEEEEEEDLAARRAAKREEALENLNEITKDPAVSEEIIRASQTSMGFALTEIDLLNISQFATRVEGLVRYRNELHRYLVEKMETVAPNLNALLGEAVGARLISHAGSLTNLSKYPASTVQILGAEKALFRALKTKGNTPKFGLLFNSTFISRAGMKNKGRISRYLANKCSIASRIDAFSDAPTSEYGNTLREQVEDRLKFFETGKVPRKNIEAMLEVKRVLGSTTTTTAATATSGGSKKRSREEEEEEEDEDEEERRRKEKKLAKKAKKEEEKRKAAATAEMEQVQEEEDDDAKREKKKKKKSKKSKHDDE